MNSTQRNKYLARRQDDGWARALAIALIPFYGLYHAVSRRTAKPLLFAIAFKIMYLIMGGIAFGAQGLSSSGAQTNESSRFAAIYLLMLIPAGTLGAKLGMEKLRASSN